MSKPLFLACVIAGLAAGLSPARADYAPPAGSAAAVSKIDFSKAAPLDEDYRKQFAACDDANRFHGVAMTGWRKCSTDKNNLRGLLKFPDGTVFFEAKMSLDIDGSWKACEMAGPTDLCPTWYNWPGKTGRKSFLDSDLVPYIVIPIATFGSLPTSLRKEFRNKTGIDKGDFAVVVYDGRVVPAIVGDGGPVNKMGEASNAVFKAVGKDRCRTTNADGHCTGYLNASLESGAMYFVFPDSARSDITPENALLLIEEEAGKRMKALPALP